MPLGVDAFFGTTTTTLIVLSSATFAICSYLIGGLKNRFSELFSLAEQFEESDSYKKLDPYNQDKFEVLKKTIEDRSKFSMNFEMWAMLSVIFIASFSLLLILIYGIFKIKWITVYFILFVNLIATVIYLFSSIVFVFRFKGNTKEYNKSDNSLENTLNYYVDSEQTINAIAKKMGPAYVRNLLKNGD